MEGSGFIGTGDARSWGSSTCSYAVSGLSDVGMCAPGPSYTGKGRPQDPFPVWRDWRYYGGGERPPALPGGGPGFRGWARAAIAALIAAFAYCRVKGKC